jgi:uncharacterized protein (UPF0335 family)
MAELDATQTLSMLSSHEERIQRLETVTSEIASSVAEQNASMQGFSVQMRMMSEGVVEKLEEVSARLAEKIGDIKTVTAELSKEGQLSTQRLAVLEHGDRQTGAERAKKSELWWKLLFWAISFSGGAVLTRILEHVWK